MRTPIKSLAALAVAFTSMLVAGSALANEPFERVFIVLEYRAPDGSIKPALFDSPGVRIRRVECRSVIFDNLHSWKRTVAEIPGFAGHEYVGAKCIKWNPNGLEGLPEYEN